MMIEGAENISSGNISITAVADVVYLLEAGGQAGRQASLSLHRRAAVVSAVTAAAAASV